MEHYSDDLRCGIDIVGISNFIPSQNTRITAATSAASNTATNAIRLA